MKYLAVFAVFFNIIDVYDELALHVAIKKHQPPIVRFLLMQGANPMIPNKFGITALMLARQEGNQEIIELLQNPPRTMAEFKMDIEENSLLSSSLRPQ